MGKIIFVKTGFVKTGFFRSLLFLIIVPFFVFSHYFPKNRAPNDFYVSGDSFREYCDFVFDELDSSFNPLEVTDGDAIFVKTDYLPRFFKNIHPYIRSRYVIVTHNSDHKVDETCLEYLNDNKIIAWFAQNMDCRHKKLIPIPIGLANRCWNHGNVFVMDEIKKRDFEKKYLAYLNISQGTYPYERIEVISHFYDMSFCFSKQKTDFKNYLIDVACSKFVISPRGNGLDTHRLWEALYLKAIPIVKTSSLDPLYEDLPVLIIQDWKDVTEEFLTEKYKEMQNRNYSLRKLDIKYWYGLIDEKKHGM